MASLRLCQAGPYMLFLSLSSASTSFHVTYGYTGLEVANFVVLGTIPTYTFELTSATCDFSRQFSALWTVFAML